MVIADQIYAAPCQEFEHSTINLGISNDLTSEFRGILPGLKFSQDGAAEELAQD
jgi:hypothetical protein